MHTTVCAPESCRIMHSGVLLPRRPGECGKLFKVVAWFLPGPGIGNLVPGRRRLAGLRTLPWQLDPMQSLSV